MLTQLLIFLKTGIARNSAPHKHRNMIKLQQMLMEDLSHSADGVTHKECSCFQKRISEFLARDWGKPYSKVKE